MRYVVDPRFGATLRRLRQERGLSVRDLGNRLSRSKSHVHDLETGRKRPRPEVARELDQALGAGGVLAGMVHVIDVDPDRLSYIAAHPRRIDSRAVASLAAVLDRQRRLEDVIGAAAVLGPALGQIEMVRALVREGRGAVRPALVAVAAQWAQYLGWLHTAVRCYGHAGQAFGTALEWAAEAGDSEMTATVLSYKGHVAWLLGQPGPTIGLSRAARRDPHVYAGQLAYDVLQEARGHAILGEANEVDRLLGESECLTERALRELPGAPPWHYYRSPAFWDLERGRALARLPGRRERATELLVAGLDALPTEQRDADWVAEYRRDLVACG